MRPTLREFVLGISGVALMAAGIVAHAGSLAGSGTASPAAGRAATTPAPTAMPSGSFAITGVRVFDGERVSERATVVVERGVITAAGSNVTVPAGMPVVDGAGRTLLPGLIDAHTHAYLDALERALVFGVTTEVDMFTDHRFAAEKRAEQRQGNVASRADLVSAGTLVTAPGGHGTEYGVKIPTITRAADAQAFVDARIAEGSDFIKIIYDDAATMGYRFPSIDRATLDAVIKAAHARKKLVFVHVGTLTAARHALEAGADGLAHVWGDAEADAAIVALAQERHAIVIPTLVVIASTANRTDGAARLAKDSALAAWVGERERGTLNARFPLGAKSRVRFDAASASVRALKHAGVTLLAGTDAPNPGTAHGISLHQELELLVEAGLSPAEALSAATAGPARAFGLADRGRIAAGLRADLILVDGDPTRDITATRRLLAIWKGGAAFTRPRGDVEAARGAKIDGDGLLSDFEHGMTTAFGAGWLESSDKMIGGSSEVTMRVVPGGAHGSTGSLEIAGTLRHDSPYPWAGAMVSPGPQPMAPADVTRFSSIVFQARGDGGSYRVMLFAQHLGNIPVERGFTAGANWAEVVIPFSAFGGVDGSDVRAVLFSAANEPRSFRLQVDDVRFK